VNQAPALIGVDVGTTGCKAIVFGEDGRILGCGFREYGIDCDEPAKAEQDAEHVWRLTLDSLKQAVAEGGLRQARAIGVSVQGDAIIPVDRDLAPVHPALLGMDYRPAEEAAWCERAIGARVLFDRTGMRPHPINSAVKALWLRNHRPAAYRKAWKILTYGDFILGKLGAEAVIDWTMASRTMAFDLHRREWAADLLQALGIDRDLLSRPEPSGFAAGRLRPEIAAEIGLAPGALLVTGGHDQTCAALGAGVSRAGIGVLSAGTADVLSTALAEPAVNDAMFGGFYPCYLYAKSDMYFTFALNHIGGILLRWFRDTLAGEEVRAAREHRRDPYDVMVESMPSGPSPVMVLPHFNGSGNPVCDMSSRGAIVGLTLSTTRADIVKAILECLTFELRINLEYWKTAGIDVSELRSVGGGARSPRWLQIRADILERPVSTLKVREAACLGAAILAGAASGVYASLEEGIKRTVHLGETYTPDAGHADQYRGRYEIYREIYPALKGISRRM